MTLVPRHRSFAGFLLVIAVACLPVDSRPPPGLAIVTVSSDDTSAGFVTDDGWSVSYERLLLSAGNVGLVEGPCVLYAENHYGRVLDLSRAEPQKLAQVRALGTCPVIFEVRSPPENALLGAGVTEGSKTLLRAPGSDPWVRNAGTGLHIAGSATKDGRVVRFAWSFRENLIYGGMCGELTFESESTTIVKVHARIASLFDDPSSPPGALAARFEPYASADTNADGVVTLEELHAVPLDEDARYPTLGTRLYRKTARELLGVGDVVPCIPGVFIED